MKPNCYNRPPRPRTMTVNTGIVEGMQTTGDIPVVFADHCATWDGRGIGPNGEPYPVAHKFDCRGCRWLPDEHRATAELYGVTCVVIEGAADNHAIDAAAYLTAGIDVAQNRISIHLENWPKK